MVIARWLLWLTGLVITTTGIAMCLLPDNPQVGIFAILAGLLVSSAVDAMDHKFDLLKVGVRGVFMFGVLALMLLWRQTNAP